MKTLTKCWVTGLVSAFVSLSASAGGSSDSGNTLLAPQLQVASDGPITATLLSTNNTYSFQSFVFDLSRPTSTSLFTAYPLNFGSPQSPTPGAQAQTPPLAAGDALSLGGLFTGVPHVPENQILSLTGTPDAQLNNISIRFDVVALQNAQVLVTGADSILSIFSTPSQAGGFQIPAGFARVAFSNVCVR